MNHVPSDQSFYIESEDEDDRKDYAEEEEEEDGHSHSDSSDANDEHHTQNKPNSYTTAWPQSYRSISILACKFLVDFVTKRVIN